MKMGGWIFFAMQEWIYLSPKTGHGNKVHFTLLWDAMLTFKRLSLILGNAAKCDFVGIKLRDRSCFHLMLPVRSSSDFFIGSFILIVLCF